MRSLPPDDPVIANTEDLYRGVLYNHIHKGRVTSLAFGSAKDWNISVDLGSKTTPERTLDRLPMSVGVVQLTAGEARGIDGVSGIVGGPLPENDAHALIQRAEGVTNSHWKVACHELAKFAQWAIEPPISLSMSRS